VIIKRGEELGELEGEVVTCPCDCESRGDTFGGDVPCDIELDLLLGLGDIFTK
jgi:hypothetical protein